MRGAVATCASKPPHTLLEGLCDVPRDVKCARYRTARSVEARTQFAAAIATAPHFLFSRPLFSPFSLSLSLSFPVASPIDIVTISIRPACVIHSCCHSPPRTTPNSPDLIPQFTLSLLLPSITHTVCHPLPLAIALPSPPSPPPSSSRLTPHPSPNPPLPPLLPLPTALPTFCRPSPFC